MESQRQIISKSAKTNYVSELGIRYRTNEVVTKVAVGKNKKGKTKFKSFTSFEPIR